METGIITVGGSKMYLLGILLLPLFVAFFFIYWSTSLNEEQDALKWFMRLLAMLMVYVTFVGAHLILSQNPNYSNLTGLFNIWAISWIFFTLIGIYLIYIINSVFAAFKKRKDDEFQRGVMR